MSDALAIFARFPRRGQVKTRLAEEIGDEAALRLYEAFLLDTIDRMVVLPCRLFLFLADSTDEENRNLVMTHGLSGDVLIRCQSGRDLGERLWNAYLDLVPGSSRVVFVGADSPTVPLSLITSAYRALHDHTVVFGPVADGGYYLVGLAEPVPEIFQDIAWGTSRVLTQTRQRLGQRTVCELSGWYDVDTAKDLERLRLDLGRCDPPLLRTSALLAGRGGKSRVPGPEVGKVAAKGPGGGEYSRVEPESRD